MGIDSATPTTSLAPGFRFHPTDEELVRYYLRRKICGKPFRFDAISDIDIYKSEPWDLPDKSRLKSRDLEWYFFSVLDKKCGNGSRTNRATGKGYWKTTGKDRTVLHRTRTVGMKKTLVYHCGRAPRGERTNWVMHEYRLVDNELVGSGIANVAFVLCKIFQKSGSGPKNGEQRGAPFVDEEWEDDEVVLVPKENDADEVLVGDDGDIDGTDIEQVLDESIPANDLPLQNFHGDDRNNGGSVDFSYDFQELLEGIDENHCCSEQPVDQNLFDLPNQYFMERKAVNHESIGEPSNTKDPKEEDYLLDEPFLDATDDPLFNNGAFLETNDLSNPIEADPLSLEMLEEYLSYFDADGDGRNYMGFNTSIMVGNENLASDQVFITREDVNGVTPQVIMTNEQLPEEQRKYVASSSEFIEDGSDIQYTFLEEASRMLGSISAPPAFASEFPKEDAALKLITASQSFSPPHIAARMIQVRNVTPTESKSDWTFEKNGNINIGLSFDLSHGAKFTSDESVFSIYLSKARSAMSRGWYYLMFSCVLILSTRFNNGTFLYSGNAS